MQEWIDVEAICLKMLDARNKMSHTCDARSALGLYSSLSGFFKYCESDCRMLSDIDLVFRLVHTCELEVLDRALHEQNGERGLNPLRRQRR